MKILILGGTTFLGRHLAAAATSLGDEVTVFTRGISGRPPFGTEAVKGDRRRDLHLLSGRTWDVVIDTSGYTPSVVRRAVNQLRAAVARFVFISSVSAYAWTDAAIVDEDAPLAAIEPEEVERLEALDAGSSPTLAYGSAYGALKALCEQAVLEVFGHEALVVRPGLLVGPFDPTDRFTYWIERVARGGCILAPDEPARPRQLLDARDLARWLLTMLHAGSSGIYNATSPRAAPTMGELLDDCREVAGSNATFVWVSERFLLKHGVRGWSDLPLWLPRTRESAALVNVESGRAVARGLAYRPLRDTIRDTLEWARTRSDRDRRAGLPADIELALLRSWEDEQSET